MLHRLLEFCGYAGPDDISDFMMTGAAVAPIVVFIGAGLGEAIIVTLLCLLPALVVLPWLSVRSEELARQEVAREEARRESVRRLTGGR